ncbi:thioredoxin [Patescibacteria group bacterium]|nr:thioredoxin [Candidatus Falkowbacteria bacterium]MBU3905986.1 thioredoxin [Patescibacteria group bacterium]MBU4015650.1 thioredoxin [Patescibacteria group bacterium]MBU4027080.1 thioredoxin [Patescibacteria group bacterium]MBU4072750.1 thioredoxin [Patescibacteria group bacterium]
MELTNQNFKQEVEENKGLVLVDFAALWCGPCKLMAPIIDELAEDYKDKNIKIGKLDIDDGNEVAEKYNVMSVPTFILFKGGEVIEQLTGYQSKDALEEIINKNL